MAGTGTCSMITALSSVVDMSLQLSYIPFQCWYCYDNEVTMHTGQVTTESGSAHWNIKGCHFSLVEHQQANQSS